MQDVLTIGLWKKHPFMEHYIASQDGENDGDDDWSGDW